MSTASALPRPSVSLASRLEADREIVEIHLSALMDAGRAVTPFRKAMQYAVLGQGQRFRPVLAMRIARLCGQENALTLRAAAAVELIHCASLVVDDLPCMDDDAMRRNRPAAHVAHGEATALLSAFGLVALAARSVVEQPCPPARVSSLIRFQCELLAVLDASGLREGQDLDLRLDEAARESSRDHINELKTIPLFVLAAQAGLIFTDPDSSLARSLRAFAREFGRAFQAVDDYLDGEIEDIQTVRNQLELARACLAPFGPAAFELEELIEVLDARCR
jgi:geranylgeranyl pyrophosphate synthase